MARSICREIASGLAFSRARLPGGIALALGNSEGF